MKRIILIEVHTRQGVRTAPTGLDEYRQFSSIFPVGSSIDCLAAIWQATCSSCASGRRSNRSCPLRFRQATLPIRTAPLIRHLYYHSVTSLYHRPTTINKLKMMTVGDRQELMTRVALDMDPVLSTGKFSLATRPDRTGVITVDRSTISPLCSLRRVHPGSDPV